MTSRVGLITEGTKKIAAGIVLAGAFVSAAQEQKAPDQPRFAVVSIHPVPSSAPFTILGQGFTPVRPGGQFVHPRASLLFLINVAYGIGDPAVRLLGLPEWTRHESYDVVAKPEEGFPAVSKAENLARVRLMLRGMLAERFGLQIHNENRLARVLSMEVAKAGIKMRDVTDPDLPNQTAVGLGVQLAGDDVSGHLVSLGCTMSALANMLSTAVKRPVLDKTGLTGFYAFDVHWGEPGPSAPLADASLGLLSSVAGQLGLQFKDTNGTVEYWIVDQVKHPTPN
jgi:uncharacterized protein (TIGR03435 family)